MSAEDEVLNIAGQCRATASSWVAQGILMDAGSGCLRDLLLDAAKALEALVQPKPEQTESKIEFRGLRSNGDSYSQEPSKLAFKIANANAIADQFAVGLCDGRMIEHFAEERDKHLPKREPLSEEQIRGLDDDVSWFADSHTFSAVMRLIRSVEKAHGIEVNNE